MESAIDFGTGVVVARRTEAFRCEVNGALVVDNSHFPAPFEGLATIAYGF